MMHIPTIEARSSDAAPWGRVEGSDEIRLVAQDAPLGGTVFKGFLLTLFTLGIYRFWYRTNLRRYYWSNTRLIDDGFDYTGTGKELLIGFLIALAVVVPLNLAGTIIGLVAGEAIGAIAGTVLAFLLVPVLIQVWLYRARRYRLARTRYRGIRFSQSGTVTGYFLASLKWAILTVLTFGITLPYLRTALQAYKIDNTWFGTQKATFGGDARDLMKPWLIVWFLFLAIILGSGFLTAINSTMVASSGSLVLTSLFYLLLIPGMIFAWMNYRAVEFRHFTARTAFGSIGFISDIKAGKLLAIYALFYIGFGAVVLICGGLTIAVFNSSVGGAMVGGIILFVVIYPLYSVASELFLHRRLWKIFTNSVTLTNISALGGILQASQDETGAFGEGFDTGFDVAG